MRKLSSLILALMACITFVNAEVYNGTCGTNLTWSLNTEDSTLTIEGSGAMSNWDYQNHAPWYDYAAYIKKVVLPNTLPNIGSYAFGYCRALTTISIPQSVTIIESYAFKYCDSIVSIDIPDKVTYIGYDAFAYCKSLISFDMPNSVTEIGMDVFMFSKALTYVKLSENITNIPISTFEGCTGLLSIDIPAGVTYIGGSAFSKCTSLASITCRAINPPKFQSGTTTSFKNVDRSIPLYVPYGSVELYQSANLWSEFTNIQALPCVTDTTVLDITTCSSYQFKGEWLEQSGIYYDTLPNYRGCDSIVELHLTIGSRYGGGWPSDLMDTITIERGESVIISKGLPWQRTIYPTETDYYNDTLKTIYGCDSIVTHYIIVTEPICRIASGTCGTNLKWELTCDSVLTITGSGAMSNWNYQNYAPWYSHRDKIVSVKVNEGVTSVGKYSFISCSVLESAELPNSVTTIGESGFGSCSKLKNINLGNGLISTGEWAFSHNPTLETITLPKSFTSLGNSSFNRCSNLKMILVDPENTKFCSVDGVLFNKDTTTIVVYPLGREETTYALPNTVKTIGYGAFWEAKKLTNIDLPEGLTTINTYGLGDCSSLESLTLPSTLTTIAGSGIRFALSTSHIKYVICKAVTPPSVGQYGLGLGAIPLYVPAESVETYKTNSNWKGFSPIRPIGSDPTVTFRDWDGTVLKIDTVQVGGTATPPMEIPEHEGSHFVGWDKDYSNVQYDIIVTAQFETNRYLVQFVDWDGTVLKSDSVWYMGWVEAPENPYRPGYAFTGWDRDFGYESLISDLVITAQYMQLDPGAVTITDGGAVNALFSVGEGKQVLFSRGNLQFNAAQGTHACADGTTQPGTWRFAGEQYYVRTWDNYTRCDSCDNWIDLFYCGTSGYNGVMPYRDDMDVETLQQVGNVEGTNYDFGVYNAISNGGNTPGAWRMFTIKEWRYLLQNRPHAYKLYNIVKINDIYGVVILPDNSDTTLLRQEINPEEYYYPYYAPSYSLNEWRQLEAKGAIFLPTGGVGSKYNGYFNVGAVNERGYYMTSYKPSSASTIMDCVGFDTTTVYTGGLSMSSAAISVRLVQDIDVFHLNAVSNNSAWGTVSGDSLYWNEAISMTATPNEGYHFVQWSDGNTDNPRTISLTADSTITAEFAPNIYTLTVTCDAEQGTINGKSGSFDYLSEHTFEAVANPGHTFLAWSDGVKENPRTIVLTHDSTITALFELGEYTDFIINVNTKDGELILSNSVVLKMPVAPQIEGFSFVGWRPVATIIEDNTIDIEAVYTANEPTSAPEVVTNPANPTQKLIREGNVYILKGDKTYTITGQKVR